MRRRIYTGSETSSEGDYGAFLASGDNQTGQPEAGWWHEACSGGNTGARRQTGEATADDVGFYVPG